MEILFFLLVFFLAIWVTSATLNGAISALCAEEVPALIQFIKVIKEDDYELSFHAVCDIDSFGSVQRSVRLSLRVGLFLFPAIEPGNFCSVHMETHREIARSPLILVYNAKLP